jgi:hypothetical protein
MNSDPLGGWHMIFNRLKFGVELTFLGFLFLLPIILLLMGTPYHGRTPHHAFFNFAYRKDILPYLAIVIAALSYLVGVFMDFLTHAIFGLCLKKSSEEEKVQDAAFAGFLKAERAALIEELNYRRTQNLVLRILSFAFLFNAPLIVLFLSNMHVSTLTNVAVFIMLNLLAALSVLLFFKAYKRYNDFRKNVLMHYVEKRLAEATGSGKKLPGPV